MGNNAGDVVGQCCLGILFESDFLKLTAFQPRDEGGGLVKGPLVLVGNVHPAVRTSTDMTGALLVMGRVEPPNNPTAAAVHQDQRGFHGVEVQLEAIVVRVGQYAAQANHQGFPIWMQCQLMGANALKLKGIDPLIILLRVIDGNNALPRLVAAGGDIEPAAVGGEHSVTDKVFPGSGFDAMCPVTAEGVEPVKRPAGPAFEEDDL